MADKNSYGIETETAELAIINQHMQSIGNYNNSGNAGNSHSSAVHQESPRAVHRGAGAILTSWLVYQGWKFPNFVSSESDDRIFFDLEVTITVAFTITEL